MADGLGHAWFAGLRASRPVAAAVLPGEAERLASGFWAVVLDFEGRGHAWRFTEVERVTTTSVGGAGRPSALPASGWHGPPADAWRSSLTATAYRERVRRVQERIRAGDVYQVNLCRVLSAPLAPPPAAQGAPGSDPSAAALGSVLAAGNPAPFAGGVHVPDGGPFPSVWVVSASPERYLSVRDGRVASSPIKGTATAAEGLTGKDRAENVMITDMVRNDLQRVSLPATVEVAGLLAVERHPGLVHLVSTVVGRLRPGTTWGELLGATFPPASVSGAPKHTALQVIAELEPTARGPYCGAVGWVDGDAGRAELAVGIRTFWWTPDDGGTLRFGTGAGITADSDPDAEWAETELKAARLVALASAEGRAWTGVDEGSAGWVRA